MPHVQLIQEMETAIQKRQFEKFSVFYAQYSHFVKDKIPEKDVFYKTACLLYFLSIEQMDKYYALLETCVDIDSYKNVVEIYNAIQLCDSRKLSEICSNSIQEFHELINKIIQNLGIKEELDEETEKVDSILQKRIIDSISVINKHNK